ncbi:MAG TPA: phage baseplate assembly protein V [Kofleriaceae bacterium]|jgi:hypothetical protein
MIDDDVTRRLLERLERLECRHLGKYQAFVVDNADPQKRGRLRLQIPEVLGPDVVSGWAEPCFAYGGGPDYGHFSIPPICTSADGKAYTTGVWVEFRGGDPQYPIWIGTFFGAPGGTSEAPGDDAAPDVDVHVVRSHAGHGMVMVDTTGDERLELRDAAGQKLTFAAALRPQAKRDAQGNKTTATADIDYPNTEGNTATITLTDLAGNQIELDATQSAPTVTIRNKSRDGSVTQTIVMSGAGSGAKITISDNNQNVVTMSSAGIEISALSGTDTMKLESSGMKHNAPIIHLNDGTQGAARKLDQIQSSAADDPAYWLWVTLLMTWLNTHVHGSAVGPTTPPVVPYPGSVPSTLTGHIITASGTVIIGD